MNEPGFPGKKPNIGVARGLHKHVPIVKKP
jgi:hypothetical protein